MKSSPSPRRGSHRAVALIIVLAFVVLLTGLIVGFFSLSLLNRQISNSSANATKADLFAQGAVDTIIGDLKQEIAAGSNATLYTDSSTKVVASVYMPISAATSVPAVALKGAQTNVTTFAPNLIKRSAYQQTFFPAGSANYSGTTTIVALAGIRPAAPGTPSIPSNRAANAPSITPSQNSRSISPARWNTPLLLPKAAANQTSDTILTPDPTQFVAPDWILVPRDGSDTHALTAPPAPTAANAIVGRYAYNIYDEGGLLDMNVAGFPAATTLKQASLKNTLAYADLSQLQDSSGAALISSTQIDQAVAWRNYASASTDWTQNPPAAGSTLGTFLVPNWTAATATSYFQATQANGAGFLHAANPVVIGGPPGQTDRLFAGRQELINLLLRGIAASGSTGKADRARLQNALQYFGTFSRDVNQPTLVPATSFASNPKPPAAALASGGNDASNLGGDTKINPSFLTVRVTTAFTRNDGTTAAVGDPLVRKRFALSRLAWLTFKGPIATDGGTLSTDPAIQTIINQLEAQGFTAQFLQQGGPTNIKKYFGLSWVTDSGTSVGIGDNTQKWKYVHGTGGTKGPIQRLDQISGREPDFIELLKAAVTTGAIAKPAATQPDVAGANTPTGYQAQKDASTDGAIIQLAANIVDQFDLDSFSTRIIFDDGSFPNFPQEFRGVEDLPYYYRMRGSLIKVHESDPPPNSNTPGPATIMDAGVGAFVEQPEIWNPHAWDNSATQQATSLTKPLKFRAVAVSTNPFNTAFTPPSTTLLAFTTNNGHRQSDVPSSPGEPGPVVLTAENTELDFQIPSNRPDLFREPTFLIKPNVPTGSLLTTGTTGVKHLIRTDPAVHAYLSGDGGALKSYYKFNGYASASPAVNDDELYLGFYLGSVPLWFPVSDPSTTYCASTLVTLSNNQNLTYRLQYLDPAGSGNYITYDEKFAAISFTGNDNSNANGLVTEFGSGGPDTPVDAIVSPLNYEVYCDPRTARFGSTSFNYQANFVSQYYIVPPAVAFSGYHWVSASQNAGLTERPDEYDGWPGNMISLTGFYNTNKGNNMETRYGLFSQNDPNAPSPGGEMNGASGQGSDSGPQYYSDPDGIIRRAMGGYITPSTQPGGTHPNTATGSVPSGLPLTAATNFDLSGVGTPNAQAPNRPIILNRPFYSVADLGYTFSGTPWKNIDFSRPESGFSGLLDVFCVNDADNSAGVVAGKVDLNTRQVPVLQAILAGAAKDVLNVSNTTLLTGGSNSEASAIATALVTRTSGGGPTTGPYANTGSIPLTNLTDLVGRWTGTPKNATLGGIDGTLSYDGFSTDIGSLPIMTTGTPPMNIVTRYRETAARALASTGQARVWNLMIDVVAQTGRYPASAANAANPLAAFNVEGEQRYWVHLAIDRYTGQILDKQVEVVKE